MPKDEITHIRMIKDQNLVDAIRTMGQLLLHRSTTGKMARDTEGREVHALSKRASYFCYVGAAHRVTHSFGICLHDFVATCDNITGSAINSDDWDHVTPSTREHWAMKLANYTGV